MSSPRVFDEASLLTTLPKDISISYEPTEDGGWMAQLEGVPPTRSRGQTEEEAETQVFQAFYELMVARRNLAFAKCRQKAPARAQAARSTGGSAGG